MRRTRANISRRKGRHEPQHLRPRARRRGLDAVVIAAGILVALALAIWPWALDQLNAHNLSAQITETSERMASLPQREREELLAQARSYNQQLANAKPELAATEIWPYAEQLAVEDEAMMAWLEIPSLGLDLPVYHGTSEASLMAGVGHLEGSSLPVGGTSTHCVLTGHSGMRSLSMFDGIGRLQAGDLVELHTLGETLVYRVSGSEVVWPDQVGNLKVQRGRDLVTLVTCTPYGVNDHRLLVHCERAPQAAPAAADSGIDTTAATRHLGPREWAVLASILLAPALALAALVRRRRRHMPSHRTR